MDKERNPFHCAVCGQGFIRQAGLTRHQRHFNHNPSQRKLPSASRYVDVEDQIDSETRDMPRGQTRYFAGAGETYGQCPPREYESPDWDPLHPFVSKRVWNFCVSAVAEQIGKSALDRMLQRDIFAEDIMFKDTNEMWETLNEAMTDWYGEWEAGEIEVEGTKRKYWRRNPLPLIKYLMSNPSFKDSLSYSPCHEFDPEGKRTYSEMWTANWWWTTQVSLGGLHTSTHSQYTNQSTNL
jgi:hypothetical protein